jgi:hypothetical protein
VRAKHIAQQIRLVLVRAHQLSPLVLRLPLCELAREVDASAPLARKPDHRAAAVAEPPA